MAMEQFPDRHHVWLRSAVRGYYLHADEDGMGVSIRKDRASLNAAWAVHVHHDDDGVYLLLHSAAYGHYLAATDRRAPFGHRGFQVEQLSYDQLRMDEIMWLVSEAGSGNALLIRNVKSGSYLRANGKFLHWNKDVTVDGFENSSTMTHWIVERIPPRNGIPAISDAPVRRPDERHRMIRFVAASDEGVYAEDHMKWESILLRGRSVYRLRNELARHLRVSSGNLVMCVRAGRYGRLTPLVDDLRRYGNIDFQVVIFRSGTPAANALRHPNVDIVQE